MIRRGKIEDITAIIELGREAASLSPVYKDLELDEPRARKTLAMMTASKLHYIGVVDIEGKVEGALLGIVSQMTWFKPKSAGDLFFYIRPKYTGHARELANNFLNWGKSMPGVKRVGLSSSFGVDIDRLDKFCKLLGLKQIGGIYIL